MWFEKCGKKISNLRFFRLRTFLPETDIYKIPTFSTRNGWNYTQIRSSQHSAGASPTLPQGILGPPTGLHDVVPPSHMANPYMSGNLLAKKT